MSNAVKVGVGVIIVRDNKVLLGERIGAHGANTWATPGGHLEVGESIEDCARREVLEETGLTLENVSHLGFTNDIFDKENKHYVTLFVKATCHQGAPEIKEPNKCTQWKWCELDKLPTPMFLPMNNFFKAHQDIAATLFGEQSV